ncbi:Hypothetical predicted protein [Paramuricea clavata]|uniref:Uncharacterized protein n=1 Tax=Paramuricea clavata TaxID=317549 RepID=A0A6S7IEC7_PARCT|nr:Hypothetical predicted protein [Paramuricea clavata]
MSIRLNGTKLYSAKGSAQKCNVCAYWTTQPKEQQKCTSATVTCPAGTSYCFTSSFTFLNGTEAVKRNCGNPDFCGANACTRFIAALKLTSCSISCYNTSGNSATGVMVTKFTLSLMVIVGLILA